MSKILVIDDEVQIRSLLARMLGLEGYEVCQAGDCKAALKQLETQSPDVALCDVFLPDGNGVDLVLNIKKLSHYLIDAIAGLISAVVIYFVLMAVSKGMTEHHTPSSRLRFR